MKAATYLASGNLVPGTLQYTAPECLDGAHGTSEKADVYSLVRVHGGGSQLL